MWTLHLYLRSVLMYLEQSEKVVQRRVAILYAKDACSTASYDAE